MLYFMQRLKKKKLMQCIDVEINFLRFWIRNNLSTKATDTTITINSAGSGRLKYVFERKKRVSKTLNI